MNITKLKSYAPQARKDFIAAVTARAHLLGISGKAGKLEVATSQPQGDATVIAGQAWPVKVHNQRQQLIARIEKEGFSETMEAVAYTWFNRFVALRYMELHGYLNHGHRALSSQEGALPDILTHASDLAREGNSGLPGLKPALVAEMRLAGNRDGELYRLLLVAQCNALSNIMPFLFERIDDETELLLPDNLLRTDSVITKLVAGIDEEDWTEVEIIGWLYQFYISEKKEQVIGTVVKSEDIPAATQLFTPNWIVQYLIQNSVGRLWLMANPSSNLSSAWCYYTQPAPQTRDVQIQLDSLIQLRINADGNSLNPESITVLDPACGSGHILVEAYEVLKAIYLERGYQARAIPRLILEKNLFGLDIDDRAAQMASFALLMKARADDRSLFNNPVKLNILSLQESKGLDVDGLTRALESGKASQNSLSFVAEGSNGKGFLSGLDLRSGLGQSSLSDKADAIGRRMIATLISTFAHAKTFGSLIQISPALSSQLVLMAERLQSILEEGDLYAKAAAQDLLPLVSQAKILTMKFDVVVANPPYMGGKGMNQQVKDYAKTTFPESKADLFAMFIERGFEWCKPTGFNSMVTMQSWMFLSSYEEMRKKMLDRSTLLSLVQLPYDGKGPTAMGISFGISIFVFQKEKTLNVSANFDCFRYFELTEEGVPRNFPSANERNLCMVPDDFKKIPGSPMAYWISENFRKSFVSFSRIGEFSETRIGLITGDNQRYIRNWSEVSISNIGFGLSRQEAIASGKRWFPQSKGGDFRRWYGNNDTIVDWSNDGHELQTRMHSSGDRVLAHNFNLDKIFQSAISWTKISSGKFSARLQPHGFLFNDASANAFVEGEGNMLAILGFLGTKLPSEILKVLNPTLNFLPGNIGMLPIPSPLLESKELIGRVNRLVTIAKQDWDALERSWDFNYSPLCKLDACTNLERSWISWSEHCTRQISEMKTLEEENNRLFIDAYGLQDELTSEVPESEISLTRAEREKDCQRLVSYVIGCIMGRYSLDAPGLIFANDGKTMFDPSRYVSFPADADGIVPLTDEMWFDDEAAIRIREFLLAVWSADTLAENMAWLAESLGKKAGETPDETIRRYLADKFYKDHLQTYKKRPIYWLFSSGKQGAFQALVYLHRYNEGTLSRMRAEYVVPLTGKIQSRIDMLEKDAGAASSTASRNKLAKEVEKLKKKHVELLAYDEQLRHHADMRITLDLDDGVKVNYGKFGDLLAEVKAVTGGASDD